MCNSEYFPYLLNDQTCLQLEHQLISFLTPLLFSYGMFVHFTL